MWMINYAAPGVAIAGLGVTYYALMRRDLDLDRQNQDYAAYILDILAKANNEGDSNCNSADDAFQKLKLKSSECMTSKFEYLSRNQEPQSFQISTTSRSKILEKRRQLTSSTSLPSSVSNKNRRSTKLFSKSTKKPLSASQTYLKTKIENIHKTRGNSDGFNCVTCSDTNIGREGTVNKTLRTDLELQLHINRVVSRATIGSNSSAHFSDVFLSSESNTEEGRRQNLLTHRNVKGNTTCGCNASTQPLQIQSNPESAANSCCSCESIPVSILASRLVNTTCERLIKKLVNDAKTNKGSNRRLDVVAFKLSREGSGTGRTIPEGCCIKNDPNSSVLERWLVQTPSLPARGYCQKIFKYDSFTRSRSTIELSPNDEDDGTFKDSLIDENSDNTDGSDYEDVSKSTSVVTVIRSASPYCYFANPRYGQRFACKNSAQIATAVLDDTSGPMKDYKSRSVIYFEKCVESGVQISLSDPTFERGTTEKFNELRGSGIYGTIEEIDCALNLPLEEMSYVTRRLFKEPLHRSKKKVTHQHHSDPVVGDYTEHAHEGTGARCFPCGHRDSTQFLLPPVLSDSIISTCVEDPVAKHRYNSSSSMSTTLKLQPYSEIIDHLRLHEMAVEHILHSLKPQNTSLITLGDRIKSLPDILQRDRRYGSVPSWNLQCIHYGNGLHPHWLHWKSVKVFICSKSMSFNFNFSNASVLKLVILIVSAFSVIMFLYCYLTPLIYPTKLKPPPPVQSSFWHW